MQEGAEIRTKIPVQNSSVGKGQVVAHWPDQGCTVSLSPQGTGDSVQGEFWQTWCLKHSFLLSFTGFVQNVSWKCKLRGSGTFCFYPGLLQFNFHLCYPNHTVFYESGVLVPFLCCAVGLPVWSSWTLVRYVIKNGLIFLALLPPTLIQKQAQAQTVLPTPLSSRALS